MTISRKNSFRGMSDRPLHDQLFEHLADEAAACVICERMRERKAVLSRLNGALNTRVMFIAEAPGRNGADRTRIPFHGDTSGRNFESLLASIKLTRDVIFITNAVLCSPRKPSGANDRPTRSEIRNCSAFLRRQIELIDPRGRARRAEIDRGPRLPTVRSGGENPSLERTLARAPLSS
jgi:uracil-DNA glycosylase